MANYVKYEFFIEGVLQKTIDAFGATDTWRAVIHTDAPVVATDTALADLTEIGNSNGYTSGGGDIAYTSTRSGLTVTATATDFVWTAVTGNLGGSTTGRYVSYYDDTSTNNTLAAYWDYGATFTVAVGETFTLDFGATLNTWA